MNDSIQTIKNNEARMRAIVETILDGIITTSELGIIETVNPAVLRMFGYSKEALINQSAILLISNKYRVEYAGYLQSYRDTGVKKITGAGTLELEGQRKDGSIFPIELIVTDMVIDGVKVFTCVVRDVSQRIEADRQRKDMENRTKVIVETVADGIITISQVGLMETVNPAVTRMFGYTEAEMVGQNVKMLMPNPYKEEHDGYLKHHRETGEKKVIGIGREVQGQRQDGTIFPIDLAVNEMVMGGVKMFAGVVRDISERVEAENRRKDVESRNKAILNTVVDGIITIDKVGIIETVNPATLNIFGYTKMEMVGQNIKMLMPNPYKDEHDGYLKHHNETGEKRVIGIGREVEGQRKDGSIFPLELAVNEMIINGKKHFTGIVRDITERKQADKLKEEFISTVSHELRTPLTSIRGSIGLLTGGLAGEFSDKAKQLLGIAHNNTERLLMLINDILDLSKIESGQMDFNFEEIEVLPFLKEAIESNHGYAEQHGVEFILECNIKSSKLLADSNRLMQVMNNLMSNAAKFAPKGDKIKISATRHHQQIRISVTDHGPGIPKALEGRIFDKFTQADSSDTRQVGGTGLGLNISKAMVEKHNGRISFVTELGVGSTFYFDIPELVTNQTPQALSAMNKHTAQRILICEDEPDIGSLLRLMLAQSGFDSDIATTAQAAKELLLKNHYVAMTLDIMLPDKDGVTLYKELRENSVTKNVPIIFVSAKADITKNTPEGISFNGSVKWINKPIDEEHLIRAVEAVIVKFNTQATKRILHVEDDADIRNLVKMLLDDSFEITQTATLQAARIALTREDYDLVLLDIGLPDGSGLDLIENIRKLPCAPQIMIFSADDIKISQSRIVAEALVKSKTTNDELIATIKKLVGS
ncbi:PAS domain S-box protein [Thiomicrorhabdus arctica]|uniref:PAS domain S-box protein n=1 Tax=Thiomicrorhabdus arctica TaxID=131540 RepID=UPI00037A29D4|nr:PAS domain S-box protein [Thiomicrorhabdus arctica]